MKYMKKTAGYTLADDKTNKETEKTQYNQSLGQNTGIEKKLVATCQQYAL
jgi:hypothetical protein